MVVEHFYDTKLIEGFKILINFRANIKINFQKNLRQEIWIYDFNMINQISEINLIVISEKVMVIEHFYGTKLIEGF